MRYPRSAVIGNYVSEMTFAHGMEILGPQVDPMLLIMVSEFYPVLIRGQLCQSMCGQEAGQVPGYGRMIHDMTIDHAQGYGQSMIVAIGIFVIVVNLSIMRPIFAYHLHGSKYQFCCAAASKHHDRGPPHGHTIGTKMVLVPEIADASDIIGPAMRQEILICVQQYAELIAGHHIVSV
jgi:hypothetical protein